MFTRTATIELMSIAQLLSKEKQNLLLEELRKEYHQNGHKKTLTAEDVRKTAFEIGVLKESKIIHDTDE